MDEGKLVKSLYGIKKFATEIGWDITHLFMRVGFVMGADFVVPLPSDYNHGMAPGYDLAAGSGLVNTDRKRAWVSTFGLALSMTPELVKFTQGGDYGELSTRALTKGAVYGLTTLATLGSAWLYKKVKGSRQS